MTPDEHLLLLARLRYAILGDPSIGMPPLDADPVAITLGLVEPPDG